MKTMMYNPPRTSLLGHFAAGLLAILAFSTPPASAASRAQAYSPVSARLTARFVVADFDGDQRPDFAEVVCGQSDSQRALYSIAFQFSNGPRRSLPISGPAGGLEISPVDINADGFLDVVVTTLWTRLHVAVLLNDGRGNFLISSPASFPQLFNRSNVQFGAGALRVDLLTSPLIFPGHDWNLSGLVTRLSTQSAAPCCSLGDFRAARSALFHHLPSGAPPTDRSQL